MACISIREYDHLLPAGAGIRHPRARTVSAASFGALLRAIGRDPDKLGQALRPSALLGRPSIQAQSFAGVIRTPDGTEIEVLPKVLYLSESEDKVESARALLITMLRTVPEMDLIDPGPAGLRLRHLPLLEYFIFQLLRAVSHVVHRGIRHDYTALGNSEPFIRGRILFAEQIRRNLGRQQLCHNEHDQFLPDCAENRLLKSALAVVLDLTRSSRNQQLGRELAFCFDEVPCSRDIGADVQACRRDPSMSHYRRAVAWAELILEKLRPSPTVGRREVQSVLFAMEDLFECYVFAKLREQCWALGSSIKVRRQLKGQFLARHQNRSMFLLKPDLSLDWNGKAVRILDTKWKLLNAVSGEVRSNKYGVSQSDIYQLFAYGRKYLRDESEKIVCLIYPRTSVFPSPLPHFEIEQDLRLYVLPFDIERGELLGLDAIQIH
jgi:5-methylcytosine-specific restriction enzyme subunit McrC